MSALLQNKQVAHVATEIVVLIGLTFYFSSKNKKLLEHIEDLSQRLEDQEDTIQKHEQIINQLVKLVNRPQLQPVQQQPVQQQPVQQQPVQQPIQQQPVQQQIKRKNTRSVKQKKEFKSPPVIYEDNEEINNEVHIQEYEGGNKIELLSDDEENDSDLDAELHEELNELGTNNSLKKEQ